MRKNANQENSEGSGLQPQIPHCLISNLRTTDQAPAVPSALFARTRHHMRCTGSELMVVTDAIGVCVAISGAAMVLESSNSMV